MWPSATKLHPHSSSAVCRRGLVKEGKGGTSVGFTPSFSCQLTRLLRFVIALPSAGGGGGGGGRGGEGGEGRGRGGRGGGGEGE